MSLKKYIFAELDKGGYITDSMLYKFCGEKLNFSTAEEYKRQWHRLQEDIRFFEDKKIKEKHKASKRNIIELENGECYTCGKEFYNLN